MAQDEAESDVQNRPLTVSVTWLAAGIETGAH